MDLNYLLEKEIRYKKGLSSKILLTFDRKRTLLILGKFVPQTQWNMGKWKNYLLKTVSD